MRTNHLIVLLLFISIISSCTPKDEKALTYFAYSNLKQKKSPLLISRENTEVIQIQVVVPDTGELFRLLSVEIFMEENSQTDFLELIEIQHIITINRDVSESSFGNFL